MVLATAGAGREVESEGKKKKERERPERDSETPDSGGPFFFQVKPFLAEQGAS